MGKRFSVTLIFDFLYKLLPFIKVSLVDILCGALLVGIVVGFLVALPRMYNIPILKTVSFVYLSFIRGTPALVQLFIIYFGLPQILMLIGIDLRRSPPLIFVVIAFGMNWGAIISEIIRGSVNAVGQSQIEAAYSIGMTPVTAFRRIIFPQALEIAAPNFFNLVYSSLKNTSLAFSVGVVELMTKGGMLGQNVNHFFEAYIALGIIYYVAYLLLSRVFGALERHISRHRRIEVREIQNG
ncbi:MAG: amino acid ABC transporter permease [Oscillospiraceae bacterium]|jgi:L-cystine transport system permease protein|nr:amino acid ABC transporter permease [Oscillospiraceae bacterium]